MNNFKIRTSSAMLFVLFFMFNNLVFCSETEESQQAFKSTINKISSDPKNGHVGEILKSVPTSIKGSAMPFLKSSTITIPTTFHTFTQEEQEKWVLRLGKVLCATEFLKNNNYEASAKTIEDQKITFVDTTQFYGHAGFFNGLDISYNTSDLSPQIIATTLIHEADHIQKIRGNLWGWLTIFSVEKQGYTMQLEAIKKLGIKYPYDKEKLEQHIKRDEIKSKLETETDSAKIVQLKKQLKEIIDEIEQNGGDAQVVDTLNKGANLYGFSVFDLCPQGYAYWKILNSKVELHDKYIKYKAEYDNLSWFGSLIYPKEKKAIIKNYEAFEKELAKNKPPKTIDDIVKECDRVGKTINETIHPTQPPDNPPVDPPTPPTPPQPPEPPIVNPPDTGYTPSAQLMVALNAIYTLERNYHYVYSPMPDYRAEVIDKTLRETKEREFVGYTDPNDIKTIDNYYSYLRKTLLVDDISNIVLDDPYMHFNIPKPTSEPVSRIKPARITEISSTAPALKKSGVVANPKSSGDLTKLQEQMTIAYRKYTSLVSVGKSDSDEAKKALEEYRELQSKINKLSSNR